MTPDERAQLRALADAATEGPWRQCRPCTTNTRGCNLVWAEVNHDFPIAGGDEVCMTNADAAFIAAARTAVPALLDRVEELEAALAAMTDMRDAAEEHVRMAEEDNARMWQAITDFCKVQDRWLEDEEAEAVPADWLAAYRALSASREPKL